MLANRIVFMLALLLLSGQLLWAQEQARGLSLWQPGDAGERLFMSGVVSDPNGRPIPAAELYVWQADANGVYHENRYRGTVVTNEQGRYGFGTVLPGQYATAKHIHVIASHPDYQSLETRMLFMGDDNLDESTQQRRGIFLEDSTVDGETFLYGQFDIVLQPTGQ